ncbi:MAG: hypothetical protein NTZ95_07720 [Candidatus Omnitrophica bacterium]|nr:hypothetical protein [Candidatus Omnitrophota bacterium]
MPAPPGAGDCDFIKTRVAQSGDKEKAKSMRQELRKTHQENVQERHEDKTTMRSMRKEAKQKRVAARRGAVTGNKQ